jgi:hypothetical protein
MQVHLDRMVKALLALGVTGILLPFPALAQAPQNPPARPAQSAQPSYAIQFERHITVRPNRTATDLFTRRITILAASAIANLSPQQFAFFEGMETLETVDAFTEKADGSKVPVPAANIITRDAASGLPATFMRDLKQRTIIFQDVQVGDTLVMSHRKEIIQGLSPENFTTPTFFPAVSRSAQHASSWKALTTSTSRSRRSVTALPIRSKRATASAAIP